MARILIVDAEFLPTTPLAFQHYVRDFFKWQIMLRREVYVATLLVSNPRYGYGKGFAPGHSVDLRKYNEGLRENQSLNGWMAEEIQRGEYLWTFYGGDDPLR